MDRHDMIPLRSEEGQKLLGDTAIRQNLLERIFSKQRGDGYCGVQSAALLMSARYLGEKYPEQEEESNFDVSSIPYKDTNMFSFQQTTKILDEERLLRLGATLKQIYDLLQAFDIPARKVHADESNMDEFRTSAKAALSNANSSKGVVINYLYNCKVKGDKIIELGHFSPLAAYHESSDRFLILDTWMVGDDVWATTEDLFNRMDTIDADSGSRRGFIITG